jgi:hypothetical protein
MQAFGRKVSPYGLALHLLVLGLAIVVVLLVRQNADLRQRLVGTPPRILAVGDTVLPLALVTLDGRREVLRYEDPECLALLLVFNTTCPACRENLRTWDTLGAQVDTSRCVVRGVSLHPLEATRAYVGTQSVRFTVSVPEDSTALRSYRPTIIPLSLVVGNGGIVRMVKTGALKPEFVQEILRAVNGGSRAGQ